MAELIKIPDDHEVLRHAKKKHLMWDLDEQGKPIKISGCFPDLFKLRTDEEYIKLRGRPEPYISVNWIDYFNGNEDEKLTQTIEDFKAGYKVGKYDAYTKMNVADLKNICFAHAAAIRVVHDKEQKSKSKSHSSIYQLPQDNDLLFDDLCSFAYDHLIPSQKDD